MTYEKAHEILSTALKELADGGFLVVDYATRNERVEMGDVEALYEPVFPNPFNDNFYIVDSRI